MSSWLLPGYVFWLFVAITGLAFTLFLIPEFVRTLF